MTTLWKKAWLVVAFTIGGATLAMAAPTRMPLPGSLNDVQGQVIINGHSAQARPIRKEALRPGQMIETRHGKAGLLLTPGDYLRIGDNSEAQMLSTSFEDARVKVIKGTALLDAKAVFKHNLAIIMDGTRTRIDKKGIYGFNANRKTISDLRGKATVYEGESRRTLKGGHQLYIANQQPLQIRKLNKRAFKSTSLYRWNKLRNKYEARAKKSVQQAIAQSGGWYGPGWYFSKFWGFYTYLPSAGIGAYYAPYYNYGPWGSWGGWGWGWGWGWGDGDGD